MSLCMRTWKAHDSEGERDVKNRGNAESIREIESNNERREREKK